MFSKGKLEQNSYSNQSINMQWQEDSAMMMLAKKNINKMEMTKKEEKLIKNRKMNQKRKAEETTKGHSRAWAFEVGFEKLTTPC